MLTSGPIGRSRTTTFLSAPLVVVPFSFSTAVILSEAASERWSAVESGNGTYHEGAEARRLSQWWPISPFLPYKPATMNRKRNWRWWPVCVGRRDPLWPRHTPFHRQEERHETCTTMRFLGVFGIVEHISVFRSAVRRCVTQSPSRSLFSCEEIEVGWENREWDGDWFERWGVERSGTGWYGGTIFLLLFLMGAALKGILSS